MVLQVDTDVMVHYSKCQGGHLYPKHNFPQLAFVIENVRPISAFGNKRQGDQIGYSRMDKTPLTLKEKQTLKEISENKSLKNIRLTTEDYRAIYEKYKEINSDLSKNLSQFSCNNN